VKDSQTNCPRISVAGMLVLRPLFNLVPSPISHATTLRHVIYEIPS
jgi:hypothetical protein